MKASQFALVLILLVNVDAAAQAARTPTPASTQSGEARAAAANSTLTKSIAGVLLLVGTLKPGMTRADVLKIFAEEGGLSWRRQHTYVYRECPYIKVTVEFSPVKGTENDGTELMEDVIVKISQPFLQWSVLD
jgi:hypothetical protein